MTARPPPSTESLLANAGWLRRLALGLARDAAEADDLVQETWLAAIERPPDDRGRLPAWLARVLRNLAEKSARSRRHRSAREQRAARPEATVSTAELYERAELQRELAGAVLSLGEPYTSTLLLRFYEDLPPRAIAERQGVPVRTVHTRLARGLKRLRQQWGSAGGEDPPAWMVLALPLPRRTPPLVPIGAALMKIKVAAGAAALALGLCLALLHGPKLLPRADPEPAAVAGAGDLAALRTDGHRDQLAAAPALRAREAAALPPDPPSNAASVEGEDSVLCGRVVSLAGEPIAGAEVVVRTCEARELRVLDLEYLHHKPELARARTDAEGTFAVAVSPWIPLDVTVRAEGYGDGELPDRYAGESLLFELSRSCALAGTVRDAADGSPAAGARVELAVRGGRWSSKRRSAVTDAAGAYRIDGLAAGSYTLSVLPLEHCWPEWVRVELPEGQVILQDVEVERGLALEGRVVDDLTGAPIAGAAVAPHWSFVRPVRSDAQGRFVLRGLCAEGMLDVYAKAEGYGLREVTRGLGWSAAEPVEIRLEPGRTVAGRVVDPGGAPLEAVYVAAVASRFDRSGAEGRSTQRIDWVAARSGPDGRFLLPDLRSDLRHSLLLRKPGAGHGVFDLPEGERALARLDIGDLVLREGGSLRGRAVDESGAPRVDHEVTLEGANADRGRLGGGEAIEGSYLTERLARTDSTGRFRFADVAEGSYRVLLLLGGRPVPVADDVRVGPAEAVDLGNLELPAGATLEGEVVGPEGKGIVDVAVQASGAGGSRASVRTDERGRFRLESLAPQEHTLTLYRVEHFRTAMEVQVHGLLPGAQDLRIVLPRAAEIAGRVLDAGGSPVRACYVAVLEQDGELRRGVSTDEKGRFALPVPEGSSFDLMVSPAAAPSDPPGHREQVLRSVLAGTQDIVVTLPEQH